MSAVTRIQRGVPFGRRISASKVKLPQVAIASLRNRSSSARDSGALLDRSEEHTSELQSLMRISYAVFCLKKKKNKHKTDSHAQKHNILRDEIYTRYN